MTKQKVARRTIDTSLFFQIWSGIRNCGWSIWILLATLLFLSLLAAINFETAPKVFVAGDIADSDVIADRDFRTVDNERTTQTLKKLLADQPPVYDFSMEPYSAFHAEVEEILGTLAQSENPRQTTIIKKLEENLTEPVADEVLPELARPSVRKYILQTLMPIIRKQLQEGLVADMRGARIGDSGLVLQDRDNHESTYRPDVRSLPDLQSFLGELSAIIRQDTRFNPETRRAMNIFLGTLIPPTLTFNKKATQRQRDSVIASQSPIFHHVQKGELLVRKGERVSRDQQLKLQVLYDKASDPIRIHTLLGTFVCSLILALGLFINPGGRAGHSLQFKDVILLSVILLLFGMAAKGIYIFGLHLGSPSLATSFAVAFPVPGAVGLVAMVFAARRYYTMCLLLSFFSMLMFHGSYQLFIYYFLGGMLSTCLITRTQSRKDVIWSLLPLSIGLLCIWGGTTLLANSPLYEIPMLAVSVLINSLLTLIILFALSPVLEILFSYSTRFRLMELMSADQPLLQEMMLTIPGTYHHSFVVSNMVEAGAKAIGANSLLCKVAALYHDAGKLNYPEYFIENQFGAPNKHDRLAPSMSALILLSHVKKGTELAKKYKLGEEIIDIIRQHHGTRLMRFFYQKAINQGENPQEGEYSYPGPRPQSKEAAILMLADSVEASSRTLADPTPARIRSHIDKIIKGIFAEGQLDESELTFKDLHYLSENFQRILTGIFHQRIAYPETRINAVRQVAKTPKNPDSPPQPTEEPPVAGTSPSEA